jgi:uncharacterized protein (DUF433 family)
MARFKVLNMGEYIVVPANTAEAQAHPFAFALPEAYQFGTGAEGDRFSLPAFPGANIRHSVVHRLSTNIADPRIAGTRIPIYRIAALLDGGMTVNEVAEDFPSLTKGQIASAYLYAKSNPPHPTIRYPKQSLKRLLRDTGLSELERARRRLARGRRRRG